MLKLKLMLKRLSLNAYLGIALGLFFVFIAAEALFSHPDATPARKPPAKASPAVSTHTTVPARPSAIATVHATPSAGATSHATPSFGVDPACAKALTGLSSDPTDAATYMPYLVRGSLEQSIKDHSQLAYVIATAEWETAHFATMYEYGSQSYFTQYDGILGNVQPGDGYRFRGRGYVQLTGRDNYKTMSGILGLDLVGNPDLAADPTIAGEIASIGMYRGLFTGLRLGNYISGPDVDFVGARRIINDSDQSTTIAGYATSFSATLRGCTGLQLT